MPPPLRQLDDIRRGSAAGRVAPRPTDSAVAAPEDEPVPAPDRPRLPSPAGRLLRLPPGDAAAYRRRQVDAVRLVAATLLVVLAARQAGHVAGWEREVFRALNRLPGRWRPVFTVLYRFSVIWVCALVVVAALVAGRLRLARDLLLAGCLAGLLARGLGLVVEDGLRRGLRAVVRLHETPGFPTPHLAVLVAVTATAAPYLARGTRRAGWVVVAGLVPAALYLGVALPDDLLGAAALGWGVAALVNLACGSPAGRPSTAQVRAALRDLGVAVEAVRLAPSQPSSATLLVGTDTWGPLRVKVLGRDQTGSRLLTKAWRFAYYKDSGPAVFLTRLQELEHEAYLTLLARDAGVPVPDVVVAGTGGPGAAVLVTRAVRGRLLADVVPAPEELTQAWQLAARLAQARLAHGQLNAEHVVVDRGRVALVDFSAARASARRSALNADVAELLVATALQAGTGAAVGAAVTALGQRQVLAAVPLLQPSVLTRQGRRAAGSREQLRALLLELREQVAAVSGGEVPELAQLPRVAPANLALAVGTLLGVGALLGAVSDPAEFARALVRARPLPLVAAVACALGTGPGFAVSLAGCVRERLPWWPNVAVQLAGAFANLSLPFGSQALQVRFLQRQGVPLPDAVAAGGVVNVVVGTAVQVALFGVCASLSPRPLRLDPLPRGTLFALIGITLAVVGVTALVVLAVPRLRGRLAGPLRQGAGAVLLALRSPRQVALLAVGNAAAYLLLGLVLQFSLAAFGQHLPLSTVLAVDVAVVLVAAAVPFPGGATALGSVGLSGALLSLGVPDQAAVGAVLVNQVVGTYVPAVPGWWALRVLLRRRDL